MKKWFNSNLRKRVEKMERKRGLGWFQCVFIGVFCFFIGVMSYVGYVASHRDHRGYTGMDPAQMQLKRYHATHDEGDEQAMESRG